MQIAIFYITSLDVFLNLNLVESFEFDTSVNEKEYCKVIAQSEVKYNISDKNDLYRLKTVLKDLSIALVKSLPK